MTLKRTRFYTIIFAVLTALLYACGGKTGTIPTQSNKTKDGKTVVEGKWESFPLGNMDMDNIPDTAYVYTPAYYGTPNELDPNELNFDSYIDDKHYNDIKFSNGLRALHIDNTLWGTVEPIADLDEDGINEFIFQTNWFIGTHISIYIYSYNKKKKRWVVLARNWCYGEDSYKDRVTKIDKSEFKFRIEYMDTIEGDILKKDTLIQIKK
jgi:hypothetical protein